MLLLIENQPNSLRLNQNIAGFRILYPPLTWEITISLDFNFNFDKFVSVIF